MIRKLSHFIALVLLMLITGLFWGTWFSMSRTMETFSVAEFIHIGKTIIGNVANPMKVIMPACILSMTISAWKYEQKKSLGFYLLVFSLALLIVVLIITVGIEVPIDNQIKQWTADTAPANWEAIRNRWEVYHTTRAFVSIMSFGLFSSALLKTFQKPLS
ncbi:anthrone oxygenase family protein [Taibaiella koreensis]|uniref:anthrone oxygenase family protein n=1 Tax=Taibaiella koreensis TaxID=1268548 RepID=UPI000E5A0E00|nr:DUF1772 domain-containing protein [Taibaiella koreensis]